MKFANDYLKELLGVQLCKLEFNLSHNDRWYYPLGEETNGRTWSYKFVCLQGKETSELISYLGGKE